MQKNILAGIALLSFSTISFGASLQSLTKDQVTQMLAGKSMTTIPLVTINDQLLPNNPVTISFNKEGKVNGQFANKPDSDPQTDQGTWKINANGTTCVTWQHWNQSKPICVNIYSTNNSIIFINQATNNFESMVLKSDIKETTAV